mgnify:CR=1 FL=1|jgi:hypothetical protein
MNEYGYKGECYAENSEDVRTEKSYKTSFRLDTSVVTGKSPINKLKRDQIYEQTHRLNLSSKNTFKSDVKNENILG